MPPRPPGRRPGAGSPAGWNFPTDLVVGEGMWGSSKGPPPAWGGEGEPGEGAGHSLGGGGAGKVWGTEPPARLWWWGVHPPTRRSNNIGVGGGALGAHSSLHSLRPPPAFPMEDRQWVINHQLPPLPTQAAMGRGAAWDRDRARDRDRPRDGKTATETKRPRGQLTPARSPNSGCLASHPWEPFPPDPSGNQLRATLPQLTPNWEEEEGGSKALAAQLLSTLEGHKSARALPSRPPGGGGSLGSLGLALTVSLPP